MEVPFNYMEWNERLAHHYFNEEMAGREVLLYANKQIINSLGEGLGDVTHFINSVKVGPPGMTKSGLCQKALQTYEGWRSQNIAYPPYIAFLVLFVLAEDTEGNFAPHAYYPRLNQMLDTPLEQHAPPSFYQMWELWYDLEKWSKEDRHEELGRFVFRIRGEWKHVGLPLSQTLLSYNERTNLRLIFDKADIDPTDAPAVNVMNNILLHYGGHEHLLQKRTLYILAPTNTQNVALKNALLEFVLEELGSWDGSPPTITEPDRIGITEAKTGLRICLREDPLSQKFETYFRFKTNRPMPDTEFNFVREDNKQILTCFESNASWSSPLKDQNSNYFNASSINWAENFQLSDPENNWHAKLKGARVRLFLPGKRENLTDWIESQRLERKTEFLVAVHSEIKDTISDWGYQSCDNFCEKHNFGLPLGWNIYYGRNSNKSCEGVDVLTLSDLLQIQLIGGIKIGRGNTYLKFGLPILTINNLSGSERVKINGALLANRITVIKSTENLQ